MQLRIWSVLDGSNPVILKGHTKGGLADHLLSDLSHVFRQGITDCSFVEKGKNVLSKGRLMLLL
jgi:hypothetical protein